MQSKEPDQRAVEHTEGNGKNAPAVGYQPSVTQDTATPTTPDEAMSLARYILFGEVAIPPLTHAVLRRVERDPERRPAIDVD